MGSPAQVRVLFLTAYFFFHRLHTYSRTTFFSRLLSLRVERHVSFRYVVKEESLSITHPEDDMPQNLNPTTAKPQFFPSQNMSLYLEASSILLESNGSLKSRIYNRLPSLPPLKSPPARLYALIIETLKHQSTLNEVIENSGILGLERKVPSLLHPPAL